MSANDFFLGLLLVILKYIGAFFVFLWEHRFGVGILIIIIQLGAIWSCAGTAATHLWSIRQMLDKRKEGFGEEGESKETEHDDAYFRDSCYDINDDIADHPDMSRISDAIEFLQGELAPGTVRPVKEIFEAAKRLGLGQDVLYTAARMLGVDTRKEGGFGEEGRWTWVRRTAHDDG